MANEWNRVAGVYFIRTKKHRMQKRSNEGTAAKPRMAAAIGPPIMLATNTARIEMASPGKYDIQYRALVEDRIGRLTSNPARTEYLAQGLRSQPATTPPDHQSSPYPKPPKPGQPIPH